MANLRIAVIGSRGIPARFGGIERHVEELYSRLAAAGCDVTIYCRRPYVEPSRKKVDWLQPLKIGQYRNCRLIVSPAPSAKGLEAFAHSFWATLLALREPYDLYHYHALGPTLFSALPLQFGKRVVASCHGLDWQRGKWGPNSRRFLQYGERFMGRRVRNLICVSEDLRNYFERQYQRQAIYIPNGAEVPAPVAPANFYEFDLRAGEYVVFFGRLAAEKEVHTLVEAWGQLETPYKLAIVGGSAQTDDYVAALQKRAGKNVVFTGYAYGEALHALIGSSRFVVNPSSMEGLPIAVLEAYALGKRVLASDIPPHRQVVKEMDWLFAPGDVWGLTERLKQHLADDLPHRDEALVQRIVQEYNWDDIARRTLEYFRSLV